MLLPWERENEYGTKEAASHRYGSGSYNYIREYLPDNPQQLFRKGDIVKFSFCRKEPHYDNWKKWFMTKKDYMQSWPKRPEVPYYASEQYAIIAARYRILRFKWYGNFKDYGWVIMMLTGEAKGYIRHYWVVRPFHKIVEFGRRIPNKMKKRFPDYVVDIYNMGDYEDSNQGRNLLLLRLNSALNKVPF